MQMENLADGAPYSLSLDLGKPMFGELNRQLRQAHLFEIMLLKKILAPLLHLGAPW